MIELYRGIKSIPDTQLLLVEGVNGAGKSAFVRNLVRDAPLNLRYVTWRGCGVHPVDLLRVAILSGSEYENMISECKRCFTPEDFAEVNRRAACLVRKEDDYYLVPYMNLFDDLPLPHEMLEALWHKELYDGNSSLTTFQYWLDRRWYRFPKKVIERNHPNTIHIFEAVTLQYPVMEMLGYHLMGAGEISRFVNHLLSYVVDLNPVLLYIDVPDITSAVNNAARERIGWLANYEAWLSSTSYAKYHGLSGLEGVIAFCEERRMIETFIVDNLPIRHMTVMREDLQNR